MKSGIDSRFSNIIGSAEDCDQSEEMMSSLMTTTSTGSNVTIIEQGRDKGNKKNSNIYVVNGSNVSEQFNNNSAVDPIPKNLKAKQKQLRYEAKEIKLVRKN